MTGFMMWRRPSTARALPLGRDLTLLLALLVLAGCSPASFRKSADDAAYDIIRQKQKVALGTDEPFTVETTEQTFRRRLLEAQNLPVSGPASLGTDKLPPAPHQPEKDYPRRLDADAPPAPDLGRAPIRLTLVDALQIGAANSRAYQSQKEDVFRAALALDFELDQFDTTYLGALRSLLDNDNSSGRAVTGLTTTGELGATRQLRNGATIGGRLLIDLAQLLSRPDTEAWGVLADLTVTVPLLRGAGEYVVTEPLKQAERNVIYAMWALETFKRDYAVQVASQYLGVLQTLDRVANAEDNYRNLVTATRRARRLTEAGRLPPIQSDQALQDELRARERWIQTQDEYAAALDRLKITLGLPTDAAIELVPDELDALAAVARERLAPVLQRPLGEKDAGPADAPVVLVQPSREFVGRLELPDERAIELALASRLDLLEANGRVYDAQRFVAVAADGLEADLNLAGGAAIGDRRSPGSSGLEDAQLRASRGRYTAGVELGLPWERTAERNIYREAYLQLELAARNVAELEDQIKLDVRAGLRTLQRARESFVIQTQAVALAQRRVDSANAFLRVGRAEVRDLLEAQESLVATQDALTAALVEYRIAELELQRDMGLLIVNQEGLWREFEPGQLE